MEIRKIYGPRKAVTLKTTSPSRTQQHFKQEVNINNIMQKAIKTGLMPQVDGAHYGDFSHGADYQTMQNAVIRAKEMFMSVPASIRAKFGNDPANLIDFVNNQENFDDCVEMGLLVQPEGYIPRNLRGKSAEDLTPKTTEGSTSTVPLT